jgi:hypothetical protein
MAGPCRRRPRDEETAARRHGAETRERRDGPALGDHEATLAAAEHQVPYRPEVHHLRDAEGHAPRAASELP